MEEMRTVVDGCAAEGAVHHVLHGHDVRAGAIFRMEIAGAVPLAILGAHRMDVIITFELDLRLWSATRHGSSA